MVQALQLDPGNEMVISYMREHFPLLHPTDTSMLEDPYRNYKV